MNSQPSPSSAPSIPAVELTYEDRAVLAFQAGNATKAYALMQAHGLNLPADESENFNEKYRWDKKRIVPRQGYSFAVGLVVKKTPQVTELKPIGTPLSELGGTGRQQGGGAGAGRGPGARPGAMGPGAGPGLGLDGMGSAGGASSTGGIKPTAAKELSDAAGNYASAFVEAFAREHSEGRWSEAFKSYSFGQASLPPSLEGLSGMLGSASGGRSLGSGSGLGGIFGGGATGGAPNGAPAGYGGGGPPAGYAGGAGGGAPAGYGGGQGGPPAGYGGGGGGGAPPGYGGGGQGGPPAGYSGGGGGGAPPGYGGGGGGASAGGAGGAGAGGGGASAGGLKYLPAPQDTLSPASGPGGAAGLLGNTGGPGAGAIGTGTGGGNAGLLGNTGTGPGAGLLGAGVGPGSGATLGNTGGEGPGNMGAGIQGLGGTAAGFGGAGIGGAGFGSQPSMPNIESMVKNFSFQEIQLPSGSIPLGSGLVYIGSAENTAKLTERAIEQHYDALIVFEVDASMIMVNRSIKNDCRIRAVPLKSAKDSKEKAIVSTSLNNREMAQDKDPNSKIENAVSQFIDKLAEAYTLDDLPNIPAESVKTRRLATLASDNSRSVLDRLAEVQLYFSKGLIDETLKVDAFTQIAGSDGQTLASGTEEERAATLDKLLKRD